MQNHMKTKVRAGLPHALRLCRPGPKRRLAPLPVILLEAAHGKLFPLQRMDCVYCGGGPGERGDTGDCMLNGGAADCLLVIARRTTERRVYHQVDLAALDVVHDVGPPLTHFENVLRSDSVATEPLPCAGGGDDPESEILEVLGDRR